jgi:double-stranded uracil-DNA glycosylase
MPADERTLPRALWLAHQSCSPGDEIRFDLSNVVGARADDVVEGGGFERVEVDVSISSSTGVEVDVSISSSTGVGDDVETSLRRLRTLADCVGPALRLLCVGLNPSLHAADIGVGFARPGNRFWPAAMEARIVSIARDPLDALDEHGIGMTDLVKRATARADELDASEFVKGAARLDRLAAWLSPRAICVLGLTGWRAARGAPAKRATTGWQPERLWLGGVPTYVMPNPSGLNARVGVAELASHLRDAAGGRPA